MAWTSEDINVRFDIHVLVEMIDDSLFVLVVFDLGTCKYFSGNGWLAEPLEKRLWPDLRKAPR